MTATRMLARAELQSLTRLSNLLINKPVKIPPALAESTTKMILMRTDDVIEEVLIRGDVEDVKSMEIKENMTP